METFNGKSSRWYEDPPGIWKHHRHALHVRFELRATSLAGGDYEAWCLGEGRKDDMPPDFLLGHLGTFASKEVAAQVCEDWAVKIESAKDGEATSDFALRATPAVDPAKAKQAGFSF